MPSWEDFKPFIITGLALGSVYAMSGVGMVVLYRATGVLNLAFGAVGAMGALIAWQLINHNGWAEGPAFLICVLFGGAVTLLYGVLFGPPLAGRDPLVKATATLGLALILLGIMSWVWSDKARSMILPTSNHGFEVSDVFVNYTQVIALAFGIVLTIGTALFLRFTNLGTAMRALANDREITATLGVPVRRVEAAAWLGSGLLSGAAGLLLSNLVGLDAATLTFLVISSLAATLIGRLRSITGTFLAAMGIGLVNALITPILSISQYRDMTPFVLATIALLVLSGRRGSALTGRAG
ncbi:MAG TPA: branched-chain amino acid ABC transporter permease [Thermoleophilaceae bacterium]|jgi:branched-chain amino acid transport system permease protein